MTVVHWYDTNLGGDGCKVLVDPDDNGQDLYVPLEPDGGYPSILKTGYCNAMEGGAAYTGSSGGWVTSTFDLSQYIGRRIWLAFVFASDRLLAGGEGWYIDQVEVESLVLGEPLCDVTPWPGTVPATVIYDLVAPDSIETTWDDSCNAGAVPEQAYSIQAGDLDLLRATGAYTHTAVGDLCDRTSPSTFSPGAGNEYYLLIPTVGGHQGGGGVDSEGVPRPAGSAVCGPQRVAECT
jgi:hypothetical protein